jgi:hypothetical protein
LQLVVCRSSLIRKARYYNFFQGKFGNQSPTIPQLEQPGADWRPPLEKVWLKRYPPSVPADIDPDQYTSLVEVFERSCRQFGPRTAFVNMG